MTRVLRIELLRSAAPGTALVLTAAGVLLIYVFQGVEFADGWTQLAMVQRTYLPALIALAAAAGARQARREQSPEVADLLASTPRPIAQRVLPALGAMTVAVVAAYLAIGAAGAARIARTAGYRPPVFAVVTAVGVLALIAAVWVGLAAGRRLPSPLTAPVVAVAGFAVLPLLPPATGSRDWLALVFSPADEMGMPDPYAYVPGRVSAAQAVWLTAVAAAALVPALSGTWRTRAAAPLPVTLGGLLAATFGALLPVVLGVVLPVSLGAVLAVSVAPRGHLLVVDAVDPVARELVCAGRVCLSRVHAGLLPSVSARAGEALDILAGLPGAPTAVHENTTIYGPDLYPPRDPAVALLTVRVGSDGRLAKDLDVVTDVVAGVFRDPPDCEDGHGATDALAAAAWLTGRDPVRPDVRAAWARLRTLPADEARARLLALREAARACAAHDGMLTEPAT